MIRFTIVIPTYRRPDVLELCLASIRDQDYDLHQIELLVIDNAEAEHTAAVGEKFPSLPLRYIVNPRNLGPGGSLNKGLGMAQGERIVLMNDDAILPPDFLRHCDQVFDADPTVGCLGFRCIEDNYVAAEGGIGQVKESGEIVGILIAKAMD